MVKAVGSERAKPVTGYPFPISRRFGVDRKNGERVACHRFFLIPHDGRFATLRDVIDHYNTFFGLGLTDQEKLDLVEYLSSI